MTIADKDTMEPLIIIRGILESNMKGRLSGEAQITAAHPEAISIQFLSFLEIGYARLFRKIGNEKCNGFHSDLFE